MAEEVLVSKLAGTALDTAATTLSFANRQMKLNTEEDAKEITDAVRDFKPKQLHSLVLEGNTLGIDSAKAIGKALESRPELQQIHGKDLFTGRLKTEIPQALTYIGSGLILAGARLAVLDLSDNAVGPVGMDGLHVLLTSPVCYTLQELHLNNNGWGPTGGQRLADCLIECYDKSVKAGTPMRLRVFVSGRSRLENPGACRLAEFFKRVKTMVKVVMPQNGIYHQGIEALAEALSQNTALQHLDLNDNLLTPKGARALAKSLPQMSELRVLNLSDCLLKTAGTISLAETLQHSCPKLEELHLGFNEISESGALAVVEALSDKSDLSILQLDGNQLGESGIERVSRAAQQAGHTDALQGFSEDEGEPDSDEEEEEEEEEQQEEGESDGAESGEEHVSPLKRDQPTAPKTQSILSPHQIQPIKCTMSQFMCQPSAAGLLGLGTNNQAELFSEEAFNIEDRSDLAAVLRRHFDLLTAVCRVENPDSPQVLPVVSEAVDTLLQSALGITEENIGLFSNTLLVYLGLIKCEDKQFSVSWDVRGLIVALTRAVRQPYFPREVRDILQTFLARPNKTIDIHPKEKHQLLQALFQ